MGFAAFVIGVIVLGIIYTHKNIKEIDDVVDELKCHSCGGTMQALSKELDTYGKEKVSITFKCGECHATTTRLPLKGENDEPK